MGVEYRAAIVVGLPYSELQEFVEKQQGEEEEKDVYDILDEFDFSRVSPYYDATLDDCIIGYTVAESGDYCETELDLLALDKNVKKYVVQFKNVTGQDAEVYLTPYGW